MDTQKKLFAFKLAEKQAVNADQNKWKARDGIAIAGCTTGPTPAGYLPGPTPLSDRPIEC
jgi:hypothetical protein